MPDPHVIPEPATRVAVFHGDELGPDDFRALQTVRRTLLGMLHHGFITELETCSRPDVTEWSWHRGTIEPEGIRDGLLDTLAVIAPEGWAIR
jgi:hypothetical protein